MHLHPESLLANIQNAAKQIRLDVLDMVFRRKAGHLGGSFSCAEILASLYIHHLKIDPLNPNWVERDRFLLSKGHAAAALYSILSQKGYYSSDDLKLWGNLGAHLQGHPDRLKTPGVDMSSGFLGHGLSIGIGLALAGRLNGWRNHIYILAGEGDIQSGVWWEGALTASKYHTSEVTVVMDYNDVQLDGSVQNILPLEPVIDKWKAFGFQPIEIHGHNIKQIVDALDLALEIHHSPTVIVAHTTKGKGVGFMENSSEWHGNVPSEAQYQLARKEIMEGE
jgi:transketolase